MGIPRQVLSPTYGAGQIRGDERRARPGAAACLTLRNMYVSRNPDVLAVFPRPPTGTVAQAAHEAETNHEMELHPAVLVGRDWVSGSFLPWRPRSFVRSFPCAQTRPKPTERIQETLGVMSSTHGEHWSRYYNIASGK